MPTIAEITGLWRRSLIKWPDGEKSDTTTSVRWMQSPGLFVDLRQPADRPSFEDATCLRQLDRAQIEWLVLQEGFAGEIHFDGVYFEWQRQIDLQPRAAFPDAGRFWFEGEVMVEEGRDLPYIEHWHREPQASQRCAGIGLRDAETGLAGILVRAGDLFMYARARACDFPPRLNLPQHIRTVASVRDAQDLIDCEISFGRISAADWRIEHSSLPFKEGPCPCSRRPSISSTADSEPPTLPRMGGRSNGGGKSPRVQGALADVIGGAANEVHA